MDIFQLIRCHEYSKNLVFDVDIVNEESQSLLHEAIAAKNQTAAIDLIHRGIDLNMKDRRGQSPLHYCALYGDLKTAQEILRHGADVNLRDDHGNNALWTAVFNARGNCEIVRLLKRSKSDPNSRNRHGRSPLDFAKQIEDRELISILSG